VEEGRQILKKKLSGHRVTFMGSSYIVKKEYSILFHNVIWWMVKYLLS
jgi:hypothetical protein